MKDALLSAVENWCKINVKWYHQSQINIIWGKWINIYGYIKMVIFDISLTYKSNSNKLKN